MKFAEDFGYELDNIVFERGDYFFEPPAWVQAVPGPLGFPLYVCWFFTMGFLGVLWMALLLFIVLLSWPIRKPLQIAKDYIDEKIRLKRERVRKRREFLESIEDNIDIQYHP